ncbi:hypothetical protein C8R44DRAFT_951432 [Mycena epipterygia]|nr:hypothetical protein C8R44DRAFT_951432 [Mycena epipterygia]
MPCKTTVTETRLNNIVTCLTPVIPLLNEFSDTFGTPFIPAISNTTVSLITLVQNVKKNKEECIKLMENVHELLYAVVNLQVKAGTPSSLPPATLSAFGELTETLYKVYVFMEGQQEGNKIKHFFCQSEMKTLLNDCHIGLQQVFDMYKMEGAINLHGNIVEMQKETERIHKELLETISNSSNIHHWANSLHNSSNSISMLPAQPKIFHGRESELKDIVGILHQDSARISILGAGGMGKTSLAKAALHHPDIVSKYQNQFFVATDSATTSIELAALIGLHIGLKPGNDFRKPVVHYFSNKGPSLLVLDNLWEPIESRGGVEELLSSLTDVSHLALMAKRPAKVRWTRPFLQPLDPLSDDAARQTFVAIAEDFHNSKDITKLLSLTDNMPLAVDLIAHLVDHEGCDNVLAHWETQKTSLLSSGHDRKSNLDISITVSLSSPRLTSGAKDLLSLLSILPDGLSEAQLIQTNLPIDNVLECKSILLRTSLAYEDGRKRLKSLVPIREHMQQFYPAPPPLIHQVQKLEVLFIVEAFNSWILQCIDNHEQLIPQAITYLGQFNDLLLDSKFYATVGEYSFFSGNTSRANQFLDKALVLAKSSGNKKQQASVLGKLAMVSWNIGEYPAAQIHARGAQRLAQLSADLHRESYALQIEVMCAQDLGDYKNSMFLCHRGRKLLELCGMSQSTLSYDLMISEAETHLLKSEYAEARNIHTELLWNIQNPYYHAFSLLNLAEIDIMIHAAAQDVQQNLDKAREMFSAAGSLNELDYCEISSGELNLREKEMDTAKLIFQKYFNSLWQNNSQAALICLESLANTSQWPACDFTWASTWTVVYLAYATGKKNKRALHKALQFLGDMFLKQGDLNTADSLFTIALETFTYMDIHRSRGECMLCLGDISEQKGHLVEAVKFWKEAQPLFECSLQTKEMTQIDIRLAAVNQELLGGNGKTPALPIPSSE